MSEGIVGAKVGGSEVGSGWKIFFWAAAIFNFMVGLAGMLSPAADIDTRIVGLLVFCFGVIYVLVARDPARFGSTLWAGVIGKVGVVALLAPAQFGEAGNFLLSGIIAIDAIFAAGFLVFLLTREDDA